MKNEKINISLLNILQPIQVVYSNGDEGETHSELVFANSAVVFDENFKNISEELMGQAVLQNLIDRKKLLASTYKVPQEVIDKITKAAEIQKMTMNNGEDFYGEN
jgi:hypothetical protein